MAGGGQGFRSLSRASVTGWAGERQVHASGRRSVHPACPAYPIRYAVTGFHMYEHDVYDIVKTLEPGACGEWKITDVNTPYLQRGNLNWSGPCSRVAA